MLIEQGRIGARWYETTDLPELVRIQQLCCPGQLMTEMAFRRFAGKPDRIIKLLTLQPNRWSCARPIGSLLYHFTAERCHLVQLAIIPEFRRLGIATYALHCLTGIDSTQQATHYTARVREHNVAAQCLLKKLDFVLESVERNCYALADAPEAVEDGYWFVYDRAAAQQQRLRERAAIAVLMP